MAPLDIYQLLMPASAVVVVLVVSRMFIYTAQTIIIKMLQALFDVYFQCMVTHVWLTLTVLMLLKDLSVMLEPALVSAAS